MKILLSEIKLLIKTKNYSHLKTLLKELLSIEIVELFDHLTLSEQVTLFTLLPLKVQIEVFSSLEVSLAVPLLKKLPSPLCIQILNNMPSDERADLFKELTEEEEKKFLSLMKEEEAKDVKKLVKYPEDTAGGVMTTDFAWIPAGVTVDGAINLLRKKGGEFEFYQVYVIRDNKLLGVVALKDLVTSSPETKIEKIMKKIPNTEISIDQEEVAHLIAKYDLPSIPVVNKNKQVEGIVTVDDALDIIESEDTEDMHKFGGTIPLKRKYFSVGVLGIVKSRLPWLIMLLFANFISGNIIQKFSPLLKVMINLTIFIPVLLNCSGNAGMQAASVVIRGLATGEIKFSKIFTLIRKEFLIGVFLGIALGILIGLRALPLEESILFGVVVAFSMVAGITLATIIGTVLPIIFEKLGFDPAIMSGPLLTTIMDIASLIIYFNIAIKLLPIGG